jgi:hypothetical protein
MADSKNVCKSCRHLKTEFSLSDSDGEASGFSSGSSDNYVPDKLHVSDFSDGIPEASE